MPRDFYNNIPKQRNAVVDRDNKLDIAGKVHPSLSSKVSIYELAGAGSTVIANGGEISGTYDGLIIAEGTVTIVGDLVARAGIYAENLVNSAGHDILVIGDCIVTGDLDCTPSSTSIVQGNIIVHGMLYVQGAFDFPRNSVSSCSLTVHGDLVGKFAVPSMNFTGAPGSAGNTVTVFGSVACWGINVTGGDATSTLHAGNGGSLYVRGTSLIYLIDACGGASSGTKNAGDGGYVELEGYAAMAIAADGGNNTGTAGKGGSGGILRFYGDLFSWGISAHGGNCSSTYTADKAGSGGDVRILGNTSGYSEVDLSAGARTGTLIDYVAQNNVSGSGGTLDVGSGFACFSNIYMQGASNTTVPISGNASGSGSIYASSLDAYSIDQSAGSCASSFNGGAGGYILTSGYLSVKYLNQRGGSGVQRGYSGKLQVGGGCSVFDIITGDGTSGTAATATNIGIFVAGSCTFGRITMNSRTGVKIAPNGDATLKISSLTGGKTTIEKVSGASVSVASTHASGFFSYARDEDKWYLHAGTEVV